MHVGNVAMSPETRLTTSFGGGMAISYASNVTLIQCRFIDNIARHGAGSDIASLAESTYTTYGFNSVLIVNSYFKELSVKGRLDVSSRINILNEYICSKLNELFVGQRRKMLDLDKLDTGNFDVNASVNSYGNFHWNYLLVEDTQDERKLLLFRSNDKIRELLGKMRIEMTKQNEFNFNSKSRDNANAMPSSAMFAPFLNKKSASIRIDILATNGYTYLVNPTFSSSYHVVFGDIGVLLTKSVEFDYYLAPCVGTIYGKILSDIGSSTPQLILTGVRADIAIANTPLSKVTFDEVSESLQLAWLSSVFKSFQ